MECWWRGIPSTGTLRYQIMLAFLSGLKDTHGKSAIWLLISQILQLLGRNELVKMTGSTSHVTSYYFWTGILGSLCFTWFVTFAQNTLHVKSLWDQIRRNESKCKWMDRFSFPLTWSKENTVAYWTDIVSATSQAWVFALDSISTS